MGNIGDAISTAVPAVGSSGPGYATDINALLTEFKARLTAQIPLSSLLANADFDLNGQAITNVDFLTLTDQVSSPGSSPTNRITAYNGDFWWVGPSGALQITNGTQLNAASIGGITGDYSGSGPMEFRYDTGNTRYDAFANQSTNTWAYVRARGFDVAAGATSNFRARILFGGGANVSYTLPSAAPGATHILTMDSSGNLAVDGALGSGSSITLSGTGDIKHGEYTYWFAPQIDYATGGGFSMDYGSNKLGWVVAASATVAIPIPQLRQYQRIKSVSILGTCGAGNSPTCDLYEVSASGAAQITETTTGDLNTTNRVTMTPNTPYTVDGTLVHIKAVGAAGGTFTINLIEVVFDRT